MIPWDNQHSVQRPRSSQARRTASRRLRAFVCLLTLLAQFALVVVHSWEMPVEAGALSVLRIFHTVPTGTGEAMALSTVATAARPWRHDPALCPVCQMLSQVTNGLTPSGPGVVLLHTSLALLPRPASSRTLLALAASAPRAPPYCL